MFKKIINNGELYLYFMGKLIYKRWINRGKGRVFHENEGLTSKIIKDNTTCLND